MLEILRLASNEGAFDGERLSDLAAGLRERTTVILDQHVRSLEAEGAWRKESVAALEAENAWRKETVTHLEAENHLFRESVQRLQEENTALGGECAALRETLTRMADDNDRSRMHQAELGAALSRASAAHDSLAGHHHNLAVWLSGELDAVAALSVLRVPAMRRRLAELSAALRSEVR